MNITKEKIKNFWKKTVKVFVVFSWIGLVKFIIASCMAFWLFAAYFLKNQGVDMTILGSAIIWMFRLQFVYIIILVSYYVIRPAILKIKKLNKER